MAGQPAAPQPRLWHWRLSVTLRQPILPFPAPVRLYPERGLQYDYVTSLWSATGARTQIVSSSESSRIYLTEPTRELASSREQRADSRGAAKNPSL